MPARAAPQLSERIILLGGGMSDLAAASTLAVPPGKRRRLFVVLWVFVALVIGLFLFAFTSIHLLSAVRAYVEGEGLWSKGQKDALYALSRYTLYADDTDYAAYLEALSVNQGDRLARLELEKEDPDLAVAYAGLLQGRNHPDDINGMIFLFRKFRQLPDIDKAVRIWTAADVHIEELREVGNRIRVEAIAGPLSADAKRNFLQELQDINRRLTPLEDDFSYTLGEAARKSTIVILIVMFVLVSVLLTVAYWFSRRLVLQNEAIHDAMHQGELQLQRILRFAPLPMLIVRSADERMVYANEHARTQFQMGDTPLSDLHARNFYVNATDRDQLIAALDKADCVRDMELQLQDSQGKPFWGLYSSQRIHYEGQDCVLTALINVDERKRAHDEMSYRAYHDTLTGLPNRAMFMDAFKRTLHRMERNQGVVSLLFIDLDHFKAVNDTLGHEMGDVLLQQVAQRVISCVREGDLFARLGGDEFVVLVEGQDDPHSMAQKILEVLRPDYDLNGHAAKVTASIGISRFPQDGVELNGLLSAADFAMYQAKTTGRDSVQFYKNQS